MKKILLLSALFLGFFAFDLSAQCTKGNCFNGTGTYRFENGDVYDGAWREGKRHGNGVYTWKSGGQYTGAWVNDKRDGYGEFQWPNSATYRGYWKDDQIIDMEVKTTTDTQTKPELGR